MKRINFPQILYFIDKGAQDFTGGIKAACSVGCKWLIEYITTTHGCDDVTGAIYTASKLGHYHLAEWLQINFIHELSDDMYGAARRGDLDRLRSSITSSTPLLGKSLRYAAKGGHKKVIHYLIENRVCDWESGLTVTSN